jgi:hypothetical protein
MSARRAATAKILPFERIVPEAPVVDMAYTSRHANVVIGTGPLVNRVEATIDLCVADNVGKKMKDVLILWGLKRIHFAPGHSETVEDYPNPHADMDFRSDEIEAFATALYQAVQLAKKQGYLQSEA